MSASREQFVVLSQLFRYPEKQAHGQELPVETPALGSFFRETSTLDLGTLQATYTSTFDLAPACSPYLGDHLFGEEHRDRARLLVGLRNAYSRIGWKGSDLPDHIAEVLAFAPHYDEAEWRELGALVLIPALRKMCAVLSDSTNPYRHVVDAAMQLTAAEFTGGSER